MNDNLTANACNEAQRPAFWVGAVSGQLPTNEEIDLIIEHDLKFSEDYHKYSEKEKALMLAATKAGAKWFRSSLIQGNFP